MKKIGKIGIFLKKREETAFFGEKKAAFSLIIFYPFDSAQDRFSIDYCSFSVFFSVNPPVRDALGGVRISALGGLFISILSQVYR